MRRVYNLPSPCIESSCICCTRVVTLYKIQYLRVAVLHVSSENAFFSNAGEFSFLFLSTPPSPLPPNPSYTPADPSPPTHTHTHTTHTHRPLLLSFPTKEKKGPLNVVESRGVRPRTCLNGMNWQVFCGGNPAESCHDSQFRSAHAWLSEKKRHKGRRSYRGLGHHSKMISPLCYRPEKKFGKSVVLSLSEEISTLYSHYWRCGKESWTECKCKQM